jgi:hypothetical protein
MNKRSEKITDIWSSKGHSILCPQHGPFVDLKRHCHNITRFFTFENPYDSSSISSWFQIASGIKEVVYISDMFDETSMWCGTAIEYENEKSKFHSRLIEELTRFNFIWSGLEAFIDSIELPPCQSQRGKINSVNYFLKNNYVDKYPPIAYYSETVNYLQRLIIKNTWYGDAKTLFSAGKCESEEQLGLKVVYKIRNLLAHGAFEFSEPDGWHHTKPLDIAIVQASSRIILFSIQMLILLTSETLKFNIAQLHESEEEGVIATKFIPHMHLKAFKHS